MNAEGGDGAVDPRPALVAKLASAEATWAAQGCGTYHYARYYRSVFNRYAITEVQVRAGQIVWRRNWINNNGFGGSATQWPHPEWIEGPNEIGSHSAEGLYSYFAPLTVELLHAECREILGEDPAYFNSFTFAANELGVPVACWDRSNSTDDSHHGIYLSMFACGEIDPCVGGSCPGNGSYETQCAMGRCPTTACEPSADGASCGAGVCAAGVCR